MSEEKTKFITFGLTKNDLDFKLLNETVFHHTILKKITF